MTYFDDLPTAQAARQTRAEAKRVAFETEAQRVRQALAPLIHGKVDEVEIKPPMVLTALRAELCSMGYTVRDRSDGPNSTVTVVALE